MGETLSVTLARFTDNISEKLTECLDLETEVSEDAVRSAFVDAVLTGGIPQSQIRCEASHATLPQSNGSIDLVIDDFPAGSHTAIEFKYDREKPGGHNQPRPQKAGALFADVVRLSHWPSDDRRLFVYVTDREMRDYLTSSRFILSRIFREAIGQSTHIERKTFDGLPVAFLNRVKNWQKAARMTTVLYHRIKGDYATHYVWVFQVT